AVSLDIGPAIAGLGIAGLALGLGAQSLVKDYVAGAFILIENQYAKGDVVKLLEVTGTVEDFTLRRTTLRDFDGTVHTVPNGLITVASNLTRLWARVTLEVTVPRGSDLGRAEAIIEATGKAMKADRTWSKRILEPPRVEHIQALGESGITVRVSGTVRASDRWAASGELRRRLLAAFAAEGMEVRAG
ncbi:MAG TPA: mechanosensitive ion channel family protein, partial [Candidatus Limnocylindrales bacterium]|nr:mechanosensitive ion channel family protein [Candidatus Limnocylindrales bacterium]